MVKLLTRKNLGRLVLILLLLGFIYFIWPVSQPIIIALLVSMMLSPLVGWCQKYMKISHFFSTLIVFFLFVLILLLSMYTVITVIINFGIRFFDNLPNYIQQLNLISSNWLSSLEEYTANYPQELIAALNQEANRYFNDIRSSVSQIDLISFVTGFISGTPGFLLSFLVFLITLFLFMLDLPRLKEGLLSMMSEQTKTRVLFIANRFSRATFGFLKAQFIVSIPIFAVSLIGLLIIVPELALTMSIIIWIIDFIPLIGSIVILAPWGIYKLLTGDPSMGVRLLILGGILLLIRRTVEPKVMGQHIGMSPLAALISMYLGASLLGVVGLLVGPLLVIAFTSLKEAGLINFRNKL
ncbi:sporulation integral membrane protein YtvI [Paenibacillus sp. 1P07SE]|uniref:sporulation integral membrane protein YtvI n=1 Tax=Paenibacillus sp. 1P07SE TaxID=3132209 RepID=UPI0039A70933